MRFWVVFWVMCVLVMGVTAQEAQVLDMGSNLRLRAEPSTTSETLAFLPPRSPLIILSRSAGNSWYEVQTADGKRGWVNADYVNVGALGDNVTTQVIPVPYDVNSLLSGVTSNVRTIYTRGQRLGNRGNVFSKVGDSITFAPFNLQLVGERTYTLAEYGYLQPMIDHFSGVFARTHNSFANVSLAAVGGWNSGTLLRASYADKELCLEGETPLECEYRVVKPAFALIMIGTNDVGFFNEADYRNNLRIIVQKSIEMGVIPILSTIPPRTDNETNQARVPRFNAIITETARAFRVPLIDYYASMINLRDYGLLSDGVHPNIPPQGYVGSANFNADNLGYGYVMRNLTYLHALDAVWRTATRRN